jgi:hypothetical protein
MLTAGGKKWQLNGSSPTIHVTGQNECSCEDEEQVTEFQDEETLKESYSSAGWLGPSAARQLRQGRLLGPSISRGVTCGLGFPAVPRHFESQAPVPFSWDILSDLGLMSTPSSCFPEHAGGVASSCSLVCCFSIRQRPSRPSFSEFLPTSGGDIKIHELLAQLPIQHHQMVHRCAKLYQMTASDFDLCRVQ